MTLPPRFSRLLTFGEVMLRLSPVGHRSLLQADRMESWVGGAEANVATQLALLGHDVAIASRVPDGDLGRRVVTTLRGYGVDVSGIMTGGERLGLYFATPGAGHRAVDVLYDRAHSAFADAPADIWDWDALLSGVDRLHLTGITPALGAASAAAAIAAAEAARTRAIPVSFDGNWRGKLWARWDSDPATILGRIVRCADILFGDHRDIALLLGEEIDGAADDAVRHAAAERAFKAFPGLALIATATRDTRSATAYRLTGRLYTPRSSHVSAAVEVENVVDRIGAGDAFVAGVLDAIAAGGCGDEALATGMALSALKHALPGDAALFGRADIAAFLAGGRDIRR